MRIEIMGFAANCNLILTESKCHEFEELIHIWFHTDTKSVNVLVSRKSDTHKNVNVRQFL